MLVTQAIDDAIDERIEPLKREPDMSMLSVFLSAGMPLESIRANIKLSISGGQNEPRDAIAGAAWATLSHPDQLKRLSDGQVTWSNVFDEYVRWISPIGMSPRRIATDHSIGDYLLTKDQLVFLMFGSANRDESMFDNGHLFDVSRDTSRHIAFGAGPHFCAGAAASRVLVAQVGLPSLFKALPELCLDDADPVRLGGWAFRGVLNLPVRWSP
jgi:cytochrome P450